MLSNPDISPSTSINWWIVTILTFHFDLVHITGTQISVRRTLVRSTPLTPT
jgi:hypothetical protein